MKQYLELMQKVLDEGTQENDVRRRFILSSDAF